MLGSPFPCPQVTHADLSAYHVVFTCRYKARHVRNCPDSNLKIKIDWLHGKAHIPSCELANSGMFEEGQGRRVGQQAEQLWAIMKAPAQLARYMTQGHWQEFVETTFLMIDRQKQLGFSASLAARSAAVQRHQSTLCWSGVHLSAWLVLGPSQCGKLMAGDYVGRVSSS